MELTGAATKLPNDVGIPCMIMHFSERVYCTTRARKAQEIVICSKDDQESARSAVKYILLYTLQVFVPVGM